MTRKLTWTDNDHVEYEDAVVRAIKSSNLASNRTADFARSVADGVQAHRTWAIDIDHDATWRGLGQILKSEESRFIVKDRSISSTWGITRHTVDGDEQLRLELQDCTWDDLEEKTREFAKLVKAHKKNLATCAALADLQERAPGTTTVGEALDELGIDLQAYLDGYFQETAA